MNYEIEETEVKHKKLTKLKLSIKTYETEVKYKNLQNRHPLSHPQHKGRTG